eukprot:191970-Pyramimonas_sp.AAC.1
MAGRGAGSAAGSVVVDVESLAGRSTVYSTGAPSTSSRGMGGWWDSELAEDEVSHLHAILKLKSPETLKP